MSAKLKKYVSTLKYKDYIKKCIHFKMSTPTMAFYLKIELLEHGGFYLH